MSAHRIPAPAYTSFSEGKTEMIQEIKGEYKTARNSGVELVKVLAIFLIVCNHVVQTLSGFSTAVPYHDYVIPLGTATTDISRLLLTMLRYSGVLGNTMFFVCSAWYLLESKKVSKEKIMSMLLDIWVISVLIFLAVFCLRRRDLPVSSIIASFLPTTFNNNWYLTCYLLFYPIHPALNKLIYAMSQKSLLRTSLVLAVLYIGINYIQTSFFTSELILWVTIYFVVAYMKLYTPQLADNIKVNAAALLIGLLGNCGIIAVTNALGLRYAAFANELFHWKDNCSPFLILAAIAMLNLARQLRFSCKAINAVSKLSLLIYVIHENLLLRTYYRPIMWHYIYNTYGYDHILLWVFIMVVLVFLFGFVMSVLYSLSIQKLTKRLSKRLLNLFAGVCGKIEKALLILS